MKLRDIKRRTVAGLLGTTRVSLRAALHEGFAFLLEKGVRDRQGFLERIIRGDVRTLMKRIR